MKIISLQSVGLGDYEQDGTTGNMSSTPFEILVGSPFDSNPYGPMHNDAPKVVSIELAASDDLPSGDVWSYGEDLHYKVTTADGHIFVLPERSYIAEWVEED